MLRKITLQIFTLIIVALGAQIAWALESYFPSSIPGISIPNAHYVTRKIVRGNNPLDHMSDLEKLGITDVLIFKTPSADEVDEEIAALGEMGYSEEQIHFHPFRWKEIENYQESCEQLVDALLLMKEVERSQNRKLFFHCTVGEDRTGLLAGLYRIAEENMKVDDAFQTEMCAHGYEAGNPQKPPFVVETIRTELTPLFLGMVDLLNEAKIDRQRLSPKLCQGFDAPLAYDKKRFTCKRPQVRRPKGK